VGLDHLDEAHRLSAKEYGRKTDKTQNYQLAESLRDYTDALLPLMPGGSRSWGLSGKGARRLDPSALRWTEIALTSSAASEKSGSWLKTSATW
jgi:hypothetical protein